MIKQTKESNIFPDSRLNNSSIVSPNLHYYIVRVIRFIPLRTASKTELRFKSYDQNSFKKKTLPGKFARRTGTRENGHFGAVTFARRASHSPDERWQSEMRFFWFFMPKSPTNPFQSSIEPMNQYPDITRLIYEFYPRFYPRNIDFWHFLSISIKTPIFQTYDLSTLIENYKFLTRTHLVYEL